jgi:endonuclease/exonuclease/phosphatase family metal-dependent hydrolase
VASQRKRKRPSQQQRRSRNAIVVSLLALLLACVWWLLGDDVRELGQLSGPRPPARDDERLRVVTWNLANFSGADAEHDLARMREVIEQLDPDVLAVQEIKDADALAALLPGWEIVLSEAGGRGQQRLGLAVRPERVELLAHAEHPQLSLDGRVRPAFSAYLRGRERGPDLHVVVVHLKAMPDAIDLRRQQWPVLVELAQTLGRAGVGAGDRDLLIVGDFNTTGPPGAGADGPRLEQTELAAILAAAELRRLPNGNGCTAYYDGARRDAWKEPSEIDLVWARGLDEALASDANVSSGTHCASERCRDFRSTDAYPQRDYERVSDHCPVVLDLARVDDD